ncbi:MAG: glycosyltransferase family 2 protein [Planctomycetes bacterium]|nr:glycosyltransferase family 2 protein [Planctomycetota bacterium]
MTAPAVDILLATYNGARWLEPLLASLDAQTHPHWRLIARDDGSTDDTPARLDAFAAGRGERVRILRDDRGSLGARGNFAALLDASQAPYAMFCDQDDVWLPDKIAVTLDRMRILEAARGADTPLLVHTDLAVVDADLAPVAGSYWAYQRFAPARRMCFSRLLVQNVVTGCATMINAALRERAAPIPVEAVMHDWWLALAAAAFGTIEAIERPTLLYRQHGSNDTGAKRWGCRYVAGQVRRFGGAGGLGERLRRAQRQAGAFADRYGGELAPACEAAARAYATIGRRSALGRRCQLFRHGLWMHGRAGMSLVKNLGLLLRI